MLNSSRLLAACAALLLALATALAAWHAHGLRHQLDEAAYAAFGRALEMQSLHALGLLALAAWSQLKPPGRGRRWGAYLILFGTLLFCSDVYLGALGGGSLGVAPFGGSLTILGWLTVAIAFSVEGNQRRGDGGGDRI